MLIKQIMLLVIMADISVEIIELNKSKYALKIRNKEETLTRQLLNLPIREKENELLGRNIILKRLVIFEKLLNIKSVKINQNANVVRKL